MSIEHYDAIIIGAGISGISAAYHLQKYNPEKRFLILEQRANLGGTWDLFNYPGIRSDSDMYTFGYNFRHWDDESAIAEKSKILEYLHATANEFAIDKRIRFNTKVNNASWRSSESRWHIETGDGTQFSAQFMFMCAGYYSYDEAHVPKFEDIENFNGEVVTPQFWPESLDYRNKKVVVIGSGATAITLVPAMAEEAEQVTMLQRSPTYMGVKPAIDPIANGLAKVFGRWAARWWFILTSMFIYWYCQKWPERAKQKIIDEVQAQLGDKFDAKHFTPSYKPWDQRVCLCPDGDFFEAMKAGKADVVTDHIETFTETGIKTVSGEHLDADIIVTATGLKIQFFGGIDILVDDEPVATNQAYVYKGMMISGIPNTFLAVGYTNASWTLKVDLTHRYASRMIDYMDKNGFTTVSPKPSHALQDAPLLDLTSGYINRALDQLPKQATEKPWRLNQNFILDNLALRFSSVVDSEIQYS